MTEEYRPPLDSDTGGRKWTPKIDLPKIHELNDLRQKGIKRDQKFQELLQDEIVLPTIRDALSSS